MPHCKNTTIINEIGKFFQKSSDNAMQRILTLLKATKMTDRGLGLHTESNALHKTSEKLILLVLFSIFNVKNPSHYAQSHFGRMLSGGKDLFYRLLNSEKIHWRNIHYKIAGRLHKTVITKGEQDLPCCLIVDDTDLKKRGFKMEGIGKIFSHVTQSFELGFKMLALCLDDGKQLLNIDFSLHGEKGKKENHGLTQKQLKARKRVAHNMENPDYERIAEYDESKTVSLFRMLKRFSSRGYKADYLLADSWFASIELIRLVLKLKGIEHYLGLAKLGNTKYTVDGKNVSAKAIIKSKRKRQTCRKLKAKYIPVLAEFQGVPVRLYICKRDGVENWRVLLTTDLSLNFEQAYEIYARRWNIEVFFKECKQYLHLGKCQSHTLNAQIASTTICMIQYNFLATVKRFECYETFGELFRAAGVGASEATVTQRIWLIIKEIVIEFARLFNIDEQIFIAKYLNDTEVFTKYIKMEFLQNVG